MAETSLVKRRDPTERLRKHIEAVERRAARIVGASQLAATFGDDEEPPTHYNGRKLSSLERRVAMDSRRPKKDAPVYLEIAHRQYTVARKLEALRGGPSPLNALAIAFVMGDKDRTDRYPVIDVEAQSQSIQKGETNVEQKVIETKPIEAEPSDVVRARLAPAVRTAVPGAGAGNGAAVPGGAAAGPGVRKIPRGVP